MCFAMFHDVVLIKKKKVIAAICASGTLNLGGRLRDGKVTAAVVMICS